MICLFALLIVYGQLYLKVVSFMNGDERMLYGQEILFYGRIFSVFLGQTNSPVAMTFICVTHVVPASVID